MATIKLVVEKDGTQEVYKFTQTSALAMHKTHRPQIENLLRPNVDMKTSDGHSEEYSISFACDGGFEHSENKLRSPRSDDKGSPEV